jgi:hypothetical protein
MKVEILWTARFNGKTTVDIDPTNVREWATDKGYSFGDDAEGWREQVAEYLSAVLWEWQDQVDLDDNCTGDDLELDDVNIAPENPQRVAERVDIPEPEAADG